MFSSLFKDHDDGSLLKRFDVLSPTPSVLENIDARFIICKLFDSLLVHCCGIFMGFIIYTIELNERRIRSSSSLRVSSA